MSLAVAGPEWERFLRHLDLAEGFRLYFLICPSAQHAQAAREACAAHLLKENRRLDVLEVTSPQSASHLPERLLEPLSTSPGELLWVSLYLLAQGGDAEEYERWKAAQRQGLAGLNQSRNLVAKHQARPLIIAGTHALLEACPAIAPDLWSIKSAVIRLPAAGSDEPPKSRACEDAPLEAPEASLADAQRALSAAAQVRGRKGAELDLLRYLIRAAKALEGRGHPAKLNGILDEALAVAEREEISGDQDELGSLLNDLAVRFMNVARYWEAEPLMRRALALAESGFGPQHPEVASLLNNLAILLQDTKRHAEAEPLFRRSLAIRDNSLGSARPEVASSLNNLARLLQATNRQTEAEPLFRRALVITDKTFGSERPEVATALNNLAMLLQDTNRHAEAEPLFRRALIINEKSLGGAHPIVATGLSNLAMLLERTNRESEAGPLYRRALAIHEKSLGPEHPSVAIDLNNLAGQLKRTSRIAEAEPLSWRALEILLKFTQCNGHEHPHLNVVMNNHLALLASMGVSPEEAQAQIAELKERVRREMEVGGSPAEG